MKSKVTLTAQRLLVAPLISLCIAGASQAATVAVPVKVHTEISDTLGQTRILVDFGSLESLAGKKILYAKAQLNIDVDTCVDIMNELEVHPLTASWNAESVDWETSWSEPGGDYDDKHTRVVGLQRSRNGDTEILLTVLVQSWVDEEMSNHGLILIPKISGCEYRLMSKGGHGTSSYGELVVRYVSEP